MPLATWAKTARIILRNEVSKSHNRLGPLRCSGFLICLTASFTRLNIYNGGKSIENLFRKCFETQ